MVNNAGITRDAPTVLMTECDWQAVLQTIDKSERENRDKTAEKLGQLAAPVMTVLEGGGGSDKLDRLVESLATRNLAQYVEVDVRIVRGVPLSCRPPRPMRGVYLLIPSCPPSRQFPVRHDTDSALGVSPRSPYAGPTRGRTGS